MVTFVICGAFAHCWSAFVSWENKYQSLMWGVCKYQIRNAYDLVPIRNPINESFLMFIRTGSVISRSNTCVTLPLFSSMVCHNTKEFLQSWLRDMWCIRFGFWNGCYFRQATTYVCILSSSYADRGWLTEANAVTGPALRRVSSLSLVFAMSKPMNPIPLMFSLNFNCDRGTTNM